MAETPKAYLSENRISVQFNIRLTRMQTRKLEGFASEWAKANKVEVLLDAVSIRTSARHFGDDIRFVDGVSSILQVTISIDEEY